MATKTNRQAQHDRDEVLRLKRTMNPTTGLPYTYQEIATIMHVTPMTPYRYVPKPLRDRCCPQCLQPLIQESEA